MILNLEDEELGRLKANPLHPTGEALRDRREESAFACSLSLFSMHDDSPDVLASCFGDSFSIIRELSALFSDITATTCSISSILSSQEVASEFLLTNFGKQFSITCEESLDPVIKSSNGEILCAEEVSAILESSNSNTTSSSKFLNSAPTRFLLTQRIRRVNEASNQIHIINKTKSPNVVVYLWLPINKAEGHSTIEAATSEEAKTQHN
uniref:Uncharacterized protein n=1 Tax=Glossina pallidipes TaxID=7398 RepID=A0A1A9ZQ08_GLOPL